VPAVIGSFCTNLDIAQWVEHRPDKPTVAGSNDEWVADKMCVRAPQMKDWLDRGVREGRILKLKKPVRYVAHTPTLFTA